MPNHWCEVLAQPLRERKAFLLIQSQLPQGHLTLATQNSSFFRRALGIDIRVHFPLSSKGHRPYCVSRDGADQNCSCTVLKQEPFTGDQFDGQSPLFKEPNCLVANIRIHSSKVKQKKDVWWVTQSLERPQNQAWLLNVLEYCSQPSLPRCFAFRAPHQTCPKSTRYHPTCSQKALGTTLPHLRHICGSRPGCTQLYQVWRYLSLFSLQGLEVYFS